MGRFLNGIFINLFLFLSLFAFEISEVKMIGLKYQRFEGPNLIWKLSSQEFIQRSEETFEAKGVYIENIIRGIKIWANAAQYLKKEGKFILRGKVRLFTEREGEVITEELFFLSQKRSTYSSGPCNNKKKGSRSYR